MQPSGPSLNWSQVIGSVVGCGVVVGMVFGLDWWRKRQEETRGEQPPQKLKLLRPAGYSAMCRVVELCDKLWLAVGLALAGGVVCGLTAAAICPVLEALALGQATLRQFIHVPGPDLMLSVALLVAGSGLFSVWQLARAQRIGNEVAQWRLGMRGEQAVAEGLRDSTLAAAGYVAFHDIPGDGKGNIDHIVVGPAGVFVLETKARSRRKPKSGQEKNVVRFDGLKLQFPWCYDAAAVQQVERNAGWVRRFLDGFPPKDVRVQPVIVVPGWYVEALGKYGVKVMNVDYLVGYLKGEKPLYAVEQLQPVVRRLEERCRTLEF